MMFSPRKSHSGFQSKGFHQNTLKLGNTHETEYNNSIEQHNKYRSLVDTHVETIEKQQEGVQLFVRKYKYKGCLNILR